MRIERPWTRPPAACHPHRNQVFRPCREDGESVELRQLRYFVALAEELHFGRAAARSHIVQSALSQQLTRLERELGVRLLDRTTHHVRLTNAGSAFLLDAQQIL